MACRHLIQKTCRPLAQHIETVKYRQNQEKKFIHHVHKVRNQTSYTCLNIDVQRMEDRIEN